MAKYSSWNLGQIEALLNIIGEKNALALLHGEKILVAEEKSVCIKEAILPLFDKHGRRIPPCGGLVANVCDPNRSFHLIQPEIDYRARLAQLEATGLAALISAAEFEARARELLQMLAESEPLKNLLKGVHLPVVIPQTEVADIGRTTEEFVTMAGKSYCRQFPKRSFTNYRAGGLEGEVSLMENSRYERLVEGIAKSSIVGICFPNPLQGFSVDAQREQMATLPESLLLSGPLDTAVAWIMYPDVLARDYNTPGYDCSAVQWQSAEGSLDFGAYDDCADFGYGAGLSGARGTDSGGLLFPE